MLRNLKPMLPKDSGQKSLLYLLCFGLLIRLVLAWLPEKYFFYLVYDDSYYYFTIARNLVTRGMLSADGLTLTNGFHPLWLFVITPIYFFFHSFPWFSIHLVITLSAFFDTAAAFLIYKTLEKLGKPNVGFWAAAFYLFNPYVLQFTMSGLETALNSFLLALLVYLSLKATSEWFKTGWFLLGAVCGLAFLSRTDNIFVTSILILYLFWRNREFILIAKSVGIAAALVFPWLAYNLASFGTIAQTSGATFPWIAHQQYLNEYGTYFTWAVIPYALKSGFYSFALYAYHYGNWVITLLIGAILVYRLKKSPETFRPLWWALAGAGALIAVHIFIRWSVRPWYPQSVFVLTLPAIVLALEKINRYVVLTGAVLVFYFAGLQVWSPSYFRRVDRFKDMLNAVIQAPADGRIGAFNSGYLQYFTDQKVINLDGFVNNEVLDYYKKEKGLEYLRKMNIRWMVDFTAFMCRLFGPYFGPKAESSLAIVGHLPDTRFPKNNILVVAVVPDGFVPPQGREVPIVRDWAARREWGSFPWPRLK